MVTRYSWKLLYPLPSKGLSPAHWESSAGMSNPARGDPDPPSDGSSFSPPECNGVSSLPQDYRATPVSSIAVTSLKIILDLR